VGTDGDAFPATYAEIAVVIYNGSGPVVAHLYRAHHDTTVAVDTLIFQDFYNRLHGSVFHMFLYEFVKSTLKVE
jgi:hypothetical protein